jgi:hypothetical protein
MERTRYYAIIMYLVQGIYLLAAALWPLLHLDSFLSVTGIESDSWLLRISGVYVLSVSVCLLTGYFLSKYSWPATIMAVITAFGTLYMDVYYYYLRDQLPLTVYFFDFVVQLIFVICWIAILSRHYIWKYRMSTLKNKNLKL